ncbi:MAG: PAS domain S-box protein, partial [Myxococcota bacterium]
MGTPRFSISRAFRLLASRSSSVITFLDRDGLAIYQSPSVRQVLGYAPEELLGANMFALVHPDDVEQALANMAAHLVSPEETTQNELRFKHADGSWRVLEIVGINALDDPELGCFVAVSRDISDRKRAEQQLRRADSQLRSLVGGLPLIAYACDMEGQFTYSDGGGLAKLGVEPGAAVGVSAYEMYADVPGFRDALRRGLAGESVRHVSRTQGAVFDNLHAPFFDADGQQIGVVGLAIDITERSRLEGELARADRLDAIGRLAGGVAHDFNNLLTVVLGNALDALDEVSPGSNAADALEDIVTASDQATELTQQLLAFARRQRVDPKLTDISDLVSTTTGMLRRTVGTDIDYRTRVETDGIFVMADPGPLEQVLVNLVLNARDATEAGGSITVRALRIVDNGADLVSIEVADTGRGMDAETLDHIFEPFYLGQSNGGRGGVGLAVSKQVVDLHGGTMRARNRSEGGLEVEIR